MDIIYDLGFHDGSDTDYYLKKGYSVVAVEANTKLAETGLSKFSDSENFKIYNAAIFLEMNCMIKFYENTKHPDWGTCDVDKIKYWNHDDIEIHDVPTVNLQYIYEMNGTPHYIKTDIEGLDYLVLEQLLASNLERPKYLSFELSRFDYYKTFSMLYLLGYTKFKLVNQAMNDGKIDASINYIFGKYHSSLFGDDLFRDGYLTFDEALTQYMKYKELKSIDNVNLALGWIDIHASR